MIADSMQVAHVHLFTGADTLLAVSCFTAHPDCDTSKRGLEALVPDSLMLCVHAATWQDIDLPDQLS